jgi:type II secretory pathway pseudopilin PulG
MPSRSSVKIHILRTDGAPRAGLTIIELVVTCVVLVIAAGGIAIAQLQAQQLTSADRELATAVEAAQSMLEELYAEDFEQVFASFNDDPDDDPGGDGTALGANFAVFGLGLQAGDVDGFAGEVVLPVTGGELREDVVAPALGMPRDLNLDGATDSVDHATDYRVLPVVIRVSWRGVSGNQVFELPHLLSSLSD